VKNMAEFSDKCESTAAWELMQEVGVDTWNALHDWTVNNKELFWAKYVQKIGLITRTPFSEVLKRDATLNICETLFQGDLERPAIHHPVGTVSRQQLDDITSQIAGSLRGMGVQKGQGKKMK